MHYPGPVLVILHGGAAGGPGVDLMDRAWVAAARHSAGMALAGGFEAVIIATDSPARFDVMPSGVLVDADDGPYAFLSRLTGLVERYGLARPAVMGSGSVPLLGIDEYRFIAGQLASREPLLVTNNFFSADLTAWTPGPAIRMLGDVPRDNVLARRLRDQAGLTPVLLPRTTATQFDLDTPTDLAVLDVTEVTPPIVRAATDGISPGLTARIRAMMPLLCTSSAEILVAGRVSSQAWQYLERETACRVRIVSEERGLAAAGPDHVPRSLLGFLLEDVGIDRFFERIARLGDGILLDTRVIEAHLGLNLSREDRFSSDLLRPAAIADPFWRDFTAAAVACPVPVILGGHSLVAGAFMALNDQAWLENDRRLASLV